jgi:hypothetical protein
MILFFARDANHFEVVDSGHVHNAWDGGQ